MVNHGMVTTETQADHGDILAEILHHIKKHAGHHIPNSDLNELIKPFYVPQMQIPSSGLLDDVNNFAPERGFVWDVMRVTANGFSTGAVAVYAGSVENEEIVNFTTPGSFFFNEHTFMVLERVRRPVFLLTGSPTLNPYVSMFGISIHISLLGKYLLGG